MSRPAPSYSCAASAYLVEAQERMALARNYFAWQGRLVRKEIGQRVVEVGCGLGNFTGLLLDREAVIAVDVERESLDRLKARFPNRSNLQVIQCDAGSDEIAALAGFRLDSCVCLNVLEHIEDDYQALRNMASILMPGGVIVLLVPAFQSLYGPVDRNLGHYRRYCRRDIRSLAAGTGLQLVKMHHVNFPGFFAWWADAHIFRRQSHSGAQIEFYDRYVIPVVERLETLAPPPFGQSLFAVLRRP